jgi:hypothetical protein
MGGSYSQVRPVAFLALVLFRYADFFVSPPAAAGLVWHRRRMKPKI